MKTYKIRVTKADIKNGIPSNDEACPVFLAVKRNIKGVICVSSFHLVLCDSRNSYEKNVRMPKQVGKWIDRYDAHKSVKPFAFTLKIP